MTLQGELLVPTQSIREAGLSDGDSLMAVVSPQPQQLCWHFQRGTCTRGPVEWTPACQHLGFCNKSSSTLCLPFLCCWFFLLFVWSDSQCTSSTCVICREWTKCPRQWDGGGEGGHGILHADASSGHKCKFAHHQEAQDPQGGSPHCTKYNPAI